MMGESSRTSHLLQQAVDPKLGLVSREIFGDPDVYAMERKRIFERCWLFLGHESQIGKPGQYITTKMGETPVILLRDAGNKIRAFINSCRHRGNLVTRIDEGTAFNFTCPYHGWCYNVAGKRGEAGQLINVPGLDGYYHGKLNRDQWGLVPVAQVDSYKKLIFGTLDPEAPPLEEYLGDMRWGLDLLLEQGDLAVTPGTARWQINCNWKFAADNGAGDNAHAEIAHKSAFLTFDKIYNTQPISPGLQRPGFTVLTSNGHSLNAQTTGGHKTPGSEWWRQNPDIMQRMGPLGSQVARYNMNIFPNLFIIDRLLMVRHPIGPFKTEIRGLALHDRNAPPDVQQAEKKNSWRKFGPSGWLEQEDGENWDQSTFGARIEPLKHHDLNYSMGVGDGEFVDDGQSPPRIESMINEHGQVWFYRFWDAAMKAENWPVLQETQPRPTGRI